MNEEPNVGRLADRLKEALTPQAPYRILFVDDGSADGTVRVLKDRGAEIETLSHPQNLGPGAAFRTGFTHVLKSLQPDDLVLTLEGDGTSVEFSQIAGLIGSTLGEVAGSALVMPISLGVGALAAASR